jgi:hypothetical protein
MESQDPELRFLEAVRALGNPSRTETLAKVAQALADDDSDDPDEDVIETTEEDDGAEKTGEALPPPPHINLFQHPDSHPGVLDILLLQKYGPEWMLWEPETLALRIPQDFHTQEVSDLNMAKIQAMKTLHLVDTPWLQWEVFVWCCMPLNNLFPDFEVMQVPTAAQCLVAIDTFNLVRQDTAWSDELKVYLGTVWRHESMFCPTDPADFFEVDKSGTDIDCPKIMEQWPHVRKTGEAPSADTVPAEQLRRMLDAHEYLKENRDVFERQLRQVVGV